MDEEKSIVSTAVLGCGILVIGEVFGEGRNGCGGCEMVYLGMDFNKKLHLDR